MTMMVMMMKMLVMMVMSVIRWMELLWWVEVLMASFYLQRCSLGLAGIDGGLIGCRWDLWEQKRFSCSVLEAKTCFPEKQLNWEALLLSLPVQLQGNPTDPET